MTAPGDPALALGKDGEHAERCQLWPAAIAALALLFTTDIDWRLRSGLKPRPSI